MNIANELAGILRHMADHRQLGDIEKSVLRKSAAHLEAKDAIDSAVPDEAKEVEAFVAEFKALECKGPQTQFEHAVGALYRRTKTLLAIVKRQAADNQAALNLARGYEQERDQQRARAEAAEHRAAECKEILDNMTDSTI